MRMLTRADAVLVAASRALAGGLVAVAAGTVTAAWVYRQLAGRNVLHAWLEPAEWLLATAAAAALIVLAGRPPPGRGVGLLRAVALAAWALLMAIGALWLDWDAARSALHPGWSLRPPLVALALAALVAAGRAARAWRPGPATGEGG